MNAPSRAALLSITERVYEEGGRMLVWSPGSAPKELVSLGNGRFANREEPGTTYDFGADSAASLALGAPSGNTSGAADTAQIQGADAHRANPKMGWLTLRLWNQAELRADRRSDCGAVGSPRDEATPQS